MKPFTPYEKLGKKARKQAASKRRVTWDCSPLTKTIDSKKLYNRKKKSRAAYEESKAGFLYRA